MELPYTVCYTGGRFLKGSIGSFAREKGSNIRCQPIVEPLTIPI
ncbi:MAG: hypothetical protein XD78_1969, partial [Desulfotomaculum sp. 46_296]